MNRRSRKPNEQQKKFNTGLFGVSGKQNIRRAAQIASQRSFTYERQLTCGSCGGPRGRTSSWKCELCEGS